MSSIPPYPRHLTREERQAVLEKAARDLFEESMEDAAKSLGKSVEEYRGAFQGLDKTLLLLHGRTSIELRWLTERVDELEADGGKKGKKR